MKILHHEQGSPEWLAARMGKPTASQFSQIVTAARGDLSKSSEGLINELLAQRFAPEEFAEGYQTASMERGTEMEPQARAAYEWATGRTVQTVGLCLSDCGRYGASPDGLVGSDGGIEIKCPAAKTHVGYYRDGVLPAAYKQQVHGCLAVTGRDWWDFVSFHPDLPLFVLRIEADAYTVKVKHALEEFCTHLDVQTLLFQNAMAEEGIEVPEAA